MTSRHAVRGLTRPGVVDNEYHASGRFRGQLYDLDEKRVFCVHDWDVPAPEEMLGLLIHLALPGRETYLRDLRIHDYT